MDFSTQSLTDQYRRYDITPDGKQFIVVTPVNSTASVIPNPEINVVLNWFGELKQHVPLP